MMDWTVGESFTPGDKGGSMVPDQRMEYTFITPKQPKIQRKKKKSSYVLATHMFRINLSGVLE